MKALRVLGLAGLVLLVTGCSSWFNKDEDTNSEYKGLSAKQLFDKSQTSLQKEQYTTASKELEALESMYPFSEYTEQGQLDLIYSYYQSKEYPSAAATAERFIHLYPRSKQVDYAYYMKGLANFQQPRGAMANVLPMDESWRDPGTQSIAYSDFATLVERFPHSKYKANAQQRMIYLRNMFAQRELNTSQYYFDRRMYVAAADRAAQLVKTYPQAPSSKQALILMYKANIKLGLTKAAEDAAAVFKATYPNQTMDV